jgi:hypothetical protein
MGLSVIAALPALVVELALELRLPWTSDNYNIHTRPAVFQITP